jgi:hypothetical protein
MEKVLIRRERRLPSLLWSFDSKESSPHPPHDIEGFWTGKGLVIN